MTTSLYRSPTEAEADILELLKLPPPYDPVEWLAEKKAIMLPARGNAFPGPLTLRPMTPYLELPLKMFVDRNVEFIAMCCGRQVGKTTSIIVLIGYIIDYAPAPTMLLLPTEELCKSMSKDRIKPIILDSPILSRHMTGRDEDFSATAYTMDGCTVRLQHSGGRVSTRSKPICNLLEDEVSAIETRAILDAEETTSSFWNRRIFKTSTPMNEKDNIWRFSGLKPKDENAKAEDLWHTGAWETTSATSCYFYHVPCPHCGEFIVLEWGQLRWDKDVKIRDISDTSWYECQACAGKIVDNDKIPMLNKGKWVPRNPGGKWVFFHLSSLYSPFHNVRFGAVVNKGVRAIASRDPEVMQEFVNNWLALPYSLEREALDLVPAHAVEENTASYKRNTVHPDVRAITIGIDPGSEMGSRIHWYMSGWGSGGRSWRISWGIVDTFDEMAKFLEEGAYYMHPSGCRMTYAIGLVDCGWNKSEVIKLCKRPRLRGRIFPVQGMQVVRDRTNYRNILRHRFFTAETDYRGRKLANGLRGIQVNTTYWKEWLYSRLNQMRDAEPCYFFPDDGVDKTLQLHLSSEKEVIEPAKGNRPARKVWIVKEGREANHYLDCAVYDSTAADALGLHNIPEEYPIRTGIAEEKKKPNPDKTAENPMGFPTITI